MTELSSDDPEPDWHLTSIDKPDSTLRFDGRFTGKIYRDEKTQENIYVTFKKEENLFVKNQSHAMSLSILATIRDRWNVSRILIFEDTGTVYEQRLETYENAETIDYQEKQKAPPITNCVKSYEGAAEGVERYPDEIKFGY